MGEVGVPAQDEAMLNEYVHHLQDALPGNAQVNAQQGENMFGRAIQHLQNLNEPRLDDIINGNNQLPVFDVVQELTVFEKLIKALIEEGFRKAERPFIYQNLVNLCNGQVNPATVGGLALGALVNISVGQPKAEAIINFAASFMDENELAELPRLESQVRSPTLILGTRLKDWLPGSSGNMSLFRMGRMDYMPTESTLRKKLHRLYGNQKPNFDTWHPVKGLASWFI